MARDHRVPAGTKTGPNLPAARHIPAPARRRVERLAQTIGWRVAIPALRARASRRAGGLRAGGVTVVTVNWNSWAHLAVLIDVVRRRSPPDTEILVVDNGSVDGSRDRLRADREVSALMLPVNLGHELALDLGVLSCKTEYVVALDVDAFPLHESWLEELLAPLDSGAQISGARLNRDYVHPCCWAMRTKRFIEQGHSFRSHYVPRGPGRDASGDVGEAISAREQPRLHYFEVSSRRGPGDVGTVFGDLVYHNFYATRFRATSEPTLDEAVAAGDAERAWEEALERYVRPVPG
jgi:glycosyltransferase involved in cell wall biosynthesis